MTDVPAAPLVATDRLEETRAFYRWLGFKVVQAGPDSVELAWPDDLDRRIAFRQTAIVATPSLSLRLEVADVEGQYRRIGAVHTLAAKLAQDGPGRRAFAVADPNGVVLEFAGPVKKVQQPPPTAGAVIYPMVMSAG